MKVFSQNSGQSIIRIYVLVIRLYVHRYDLTPDSRSSRTRYVPMLEPVRELGGEHEKNSVYQFRCVCVETLGLIN